MHEINDNQQLRCIPIDDAVPALPVVVQITIGVSIRYEEAAWPPVWRIAGCQGFQTIDELPFIATSLIDAKMLYGPKRNVS